MVKISALEWICDIWWHYIQDEQILIIGSYPEGLKSFSYCRHGSFPLAIDALNRV